MLPFGILLLQALVFGFYRMPPQSGPAPLWVSLLALGIAYAACLLVAAGLGMAPLGRRR